MAQIPETQGREWDGPGVWGKKMHAIAFGVDKQRDSAVEPKKLSLITCDGTGWRNNVRKHVYRVCVTGLLCCTAGAGTTL